MGSYQGSMLWTIDSGLTVEVRRGADSVPAAKPAPDGLLICCEDLGNLKASTCLSTHTLPCIVSSRWLRFVLLTPCPTDRHLRSVMLPMLRSRELLWIHCVSKLENPGAFTLEMAQTMAGRPRRLAWHPSELRGALVRLRTGRLLELSAPVYLHT